MSGTAIHPGQKLASRRYRTVLIPLCCQRACLGRAVRPIGWWRPGRRQRTSGIPPRL